MQFFALLEQALGADERMRLEITREGVQLRILVQPILKSAPDHEDEADQLVRAALAHPLTFCGTAQQIDQELPAALHAYAEKRRTLHGTASDLDALDKAIAQTQQAVQAKRQKAAAQSQAPKGAQTDAEPKASPVVVPVETSATSNPDSLF